MEWRNAILMSKYKYWQQKAINIKKLHSLQVTIAINIKESNF